MATYDKNTWDDRLNESHELLLFWSQRLVIVCLEQMVVEYGAQYRHHSELCLSRYIWEHISHIHIGSDWRVGLEVVFSDKVQHYA